MFVQLTRMWLLNLVTQELLGLYTAPDRAQSFTAPTEVRVYGGGRKRSITRAGLGRTWAFELQEVTLAQIGTLTGWCDAGVTLLARDNRGQSMYGTFASVDVGERAAQTPLGAFYTAKITLLAVDVVEGV